MKRILVLDSEASAREAIRAIFWGFYETQMATTPTDALSLMGRAHFDLVIVDLFMPGIEAPSFLREVRKIAPEIPIIAVSAFYSTRFFLDSVCFQNIGYICKPFDAHELRNLVAQTLLAAQSARQQASMHREISKNLLANMIGESGQVQTAVDAARRASQTIAPILIFGEVGSGRELLARQIHAWSPRSDEPFIKVECNRLDEQTICSELFGELGSVVDSEVKSGAVDLAGEGTILIDDAQALSPGALNRIRDTIHFKEFRRLGDAQKTIPHIARFCFSFDVSKPHSQGTQTFLQEMTDRFFAHSIHLPPLRSRKEDIPILCAQYLNQLRTILNARTRSIEPAALHKLQDYSWPGNMRELRNVLERILVLHGDEEMLREQFLPREINGNPLPAFDPAMISFREATDNLHRQMIVTALKKTKGKIRRAATLLHLTPRILQHRMEKLKIDTEAFKPM